MTFNRRAFLSTTGTGILVAGAGAAAWPGLAFGNIPGERRLVLIVLRGALDGLHAVVPYGDPAYAGARGALALALNGEGTQAGGASKPLHRLSEGFALHSELGFIARLFARREAQVFHAVATAYRERSHFDGQNILETGSLTAYALRDGWLNRALASLPAGTPPALALAQAVPAVLLGGAEVTSYAPSRLPIPAEDTFSRIARLYEHDPQLRRLWAQAMGAREMAQDAGLAAAGRVGGNAGAPQAGTGAAAAVGSLGGAAGVGGAAREAAATAARFLAQPNGPRVAVLEIDGWDTHAQQMPRLNNLLGQLDRSVEALATGLGTRWSDTAVLVVTEFGRTVRPNGTGGTDHGTGAAAFLLGGAIAGGRVQTDWPGLASDQLHEGRDLRPTLDLRRVIKAVLHDHLGVARAVLDRSVFPDSAAVTPLDGLFRA